MEYSYVQAGECMFQILAGVSPRIFHGFRRNRQVLLSLIREKSREINRTDLARRDVFQDESVIAPFQRDPHHLLIHD